MANQVSDLTLAIKVGFFVILNVEFCQQLQAADEKEYQVLF